ncbi:hypothetical protein SMKI_05G0020 [Saccharomyces mikatae IFO 1815]|uniref:Uncharacterized protein n=1 Tax=Saccharomyces mikatae IFO 1815 TaxID=226126 RepID=A0AA35IXM0_SACMI|nr:uncharacterized protein SMKI_05G0020 [Saccharomyces mikatae IFO 1815]CAI4038393.1 hypothetical protein SMKI_05G0020 [Saccharomyces mikatae IFO 1815]
MQLMTFLLILFAWVSYSIATQTSWSDGLMRTLATGVGSTASDAPTYRCFCDINMNWIEMEKIAELVSQNYINNTSNIDVDLSNTILDAIDPLKSRVCKDLSKPDLFNNKPNLRHESVSIIQRISNVLFAGIEQLFSRLVTIIKANQHCTGITSYPTSRSRGNLSKKLTVYLWVSWFQINDVTDTDSIYIIAVSLPKVQTTSISSVISKEVRKWIFDEARKTNLASWCSKNVINNNWEANFRFLKWNGEKLFQQNIWDIPCQSIQMTMH